MTFSSAWTYLVSMRQKIQDFNSEMAKNFTKEVLLEYLLSGLHISFDNILQSLDASVSLDPYEKLEILERNEKKYDLSARAESAHPTITDKIVSGRPKKCQIGKNSSNKMRCHFCEQEHVKNQCELRRLMMEMVSDFQTAKAREEEKRSKLSHKYRSKKTRALTAQKGSNSDSSANESSEIFENDGDSEGELCHFTKEQSPSKIPESNWCSDSGSTTHMTDQSTLLRGAMKKFKRRTIKVRGGKLYADYMGQVEMIVNGVSLLLENVLFVPGLGVNLLSSRKLCTEWNCLGNFSDKSMWFTNQNNEFIIQAAWS
ncbi:hypothetical protein EPUL_003570 [Erysiphe pulchra]|uniref:Retrovirus-related Pol polyprotein from transposon TNT 1-94-like beta-barrel domain-containing protein n=1 Tax=Erysiphe pulchra TaxID=225359 RepID=A0A2S4PLH9_9PEZI|nr:hypothetical protein EPUL_003570 [Erysiphe pulchra]